VNRKNAAEEAHPAEAIPLADDPLWYKDAVIYELHVRAFFDSSNDGVGDFKGLTSKLDYLQDLGVNTLWLLPFYPSPMKDDGYDISDYRGVNPDYGTRADFQQFVREAHRRGMRVITELVINHTSDQHPWFQAARRAPAGSAKRDFYVWSDSDKRFPETRIIFTDSETSNWAWDNVAQAYYWHRFFSHQPDLNHNNPQVVKAMTRVMRHWLDMGVDGLRLDAIPYLCVREGTGNENLPETHQAIKQMRAVIDGHYRNRMLLAEANQWPEDVREYFGDGDECHMAYHFPLMPRIYMAVAQEDRHPIVEILRQTPDIPDLCQWAIFLRNHDELTLEMVTKRERDYLYQMYAEDPRMRLNLGIRRRLAPLLDNDRQKIELVSWLLMTMPGSPIIYYGDEIGMGDNIYLGDRNAVRTPMQWSPDRNAGFSRADPQRLYLPPIMDPVYGYESLNVESQSRSSSSLLNWTKRLIAVRKGHRSFGRGTIRFIEPGNRKILAYLREYQDESILCVANLSRYPQAVELNLPEFKGRVPVELWGHTSFPPVGSLSYLLSLPGYGFFAFLLSTDAPPPLWHEEKLARPELPVLVLLEGWRTLLTPKGGANDIRRAMASRTRDQLQREVLAPYISTKHWFTARGQAIERVEIVEEGQWKAGDSAGWLLTLIEVKCAGLEPQRYFLPLSIAWEDEPASRHEHLGIWILAKVRQKERTGVLFSAFGDDRFCRELVHAIGKNLSMPFGSGHIQFTATGAYGDLVMEELGELHRPALEQTNTNIIFNGQLFLKNYRRLYPGINPEFEMGAFLTEISPFPHIAPIAGKAEYRLGDGTVTALALLQRYVENQGDLWTYTRDYLDRLLGTVLAESRLPEEEHTETNHSFYLSLMETLGRRIGELHCALDKATGNPDFDPEPLTVEHIVHWVDHTADLVHSVCDRMEGAYEHLPEAVKPNAKLLLDARFGLIEHIRRLSVDPGGLTRIRCHGNLKLAQVLMVENDFIITDFEGDTDQPVEIRRAKHTPLQDVAGLLRSLHYAAEASLRHCPADRPEDCRLARQLAREWERRAADALLAGYAATSAGRAYYPADETLRRTLIWHAELDLELRQIERDLHQRRDWLDIPLRELLQRLGNDNLGN